MSLTNCKAKKIGEASISYTIFQADTSLPLAFETVLVTLMHVLRKAKPTYEFQSGRKIDHLLFTDDLNFISIALDSFIHKLRTFSENVGMKFQIRKYVTSLMKKEKDVRTNDIEMSDYKVIKLLN